MHVFRADHLAQESQLVFFLLRKTISPASSFPQLPALPCVWLNPLGLFLVQYDMSIDTVLVQLKL